MGLILSKDDKIDGRDILKILEDVNDHYIGQAYVYIMALRDMSVIEKRREVNNGEKTKCT